ncbi:MAG: hypothetical protein KDE22_14630, partial [Rhodobacterales bacterium]|nr:hypothetical protein [Rhodobacterales bacterium]
MADQPIIVKKIKKGGHGHHGGAWKVAYADFVTAMMAFFLLLWLLNSVTQEQLEGISNYFAPVSASTSTSGSGGVLGGTTVADDGALTDVTSRAAKVQELPPPQAGDGPVDDRAEAPPGAPPETLTESEAERLLKAREEEQFKQAEADLRAAIEQVPGFRRLKDSLLIENTPEGLRIQIVDQEGLAMFPSGSAEMYLHTRKVLEVVAQIINKMPQDLSISGHTDAVPFGGAGGYG